MPSKTIKQNSRPTLKREAKSKIINYIDNLVTQKGKGKKERGRRRKLSNLGERDNTKARETSTSQQSNDSNNSENEKEKLSQATSPSTSQPTNLTPSQQIDQIPNDHNTYTPLTNVFTTNLEFFDYEYGPNYSFNDSYDNFDYDYNLNFINMIQ